MSKQEINIGDLVSLPIYVDDLTYTVLEKRYDVIKPGLFGFKIGHHIIFYKKGNNDHSIVFSKGTG